MLEYLIKGLDYLTQEELHKLKKIIQDALEAAYIYEFIKICDGHINNGKFDDSKLEHENFKLEHENFIIGLIGKLFIDLARQDCIIPVIRYFSSKENIYSLSAKIWLGHNNELYIKDMNVGFEGPIENMVAIAEMH